MTVIPITTTHRDYANSNKISVSGEIQDPYLNPHYFTGCLDALKFEGSRPYQREAPHIDLILLESILQQRRSVGSLK